MSNVIIKNFIQKLIIIRLNLRRGEGAKLNCIRTTRNESIEFSNGHCATREQHYWFFNLS